MPTTKKKQQQRISRGNKAAERETKRSVIHNEIAVEVCVGDEAVTYDKAKELLGWEEEPEKSKFGNNFLTTYEGKKIRCSNNVTNRPLYQSIIDVLKQDILRGHWNFNGEPIIIGRTGLILNGQHTLIAFIIAVDDYRKSPESYPAFNSEPTIEKLIVYGVAEDDKTVNTMDTCKPRSLADVIYRAAYFKDLPNKSQKLVARMTEFAIKMLWHRTGMHSNAFTIKRTHSESVDFLEKHPKILEAVRHVYEEDDESKKIGKFMTTGNAAAALYLMASSDTEPEPYYTANEPNETFVNFDKWERACEFFVELAAGATSLKAVRDAIVKLLQEGAGSLWERWAVIAKAWQPYSEEKPVTAKHVTLQFEVKNDIRHLAEHPLFGGIDVGEEPEFATNADDEVGKRKEKVREKKFGKSPVASRKGQTWAKGDTGWVHTKGEDAYFATLTNDPYGCSDGIERVMVSSDEGEWEVAVIDLSLAQFETK